MEPTMNLRFVKRYEGTQLRFILQQQWIESGNLPHGRVKPRNEEWRDIPLVEEK